MATLKHEPTTLDAQAILDEAQVLYEDYVRLADLDLVGAIGKEDSLDEWTTGDVPLGLVVQD